MNTININDYEYAAKVPPTSSERTNIASQLEAVKRQVFTEYRSALEANDQLLRLALIEAEALARQTDYPHLLYPLLAAEKAGNAARWQWHQQYLLRSREALAA